MSSIKLYYNAGQLVANPFTNVVAWDVVVPALTEFMDRCAAHGTVMVADKYEFVIRWVIINISAVSMISSTYSDAYAYSADEIRAEVFAYDLANVKTMKFDIKQKNDKRTTTMAFVDKE